MLESYDTFLPIFPGFYGTWFEDYDMEDYEIKSELESLADTYHLHPDVVYALHNFGANWQLVDVDYENYRHDLAIDCCQWVEYQLQHLFGKECKVEFQEIHSPREYNFENDAIYCAIKVDLDKVIKYIREHWEEFSERIKESYTSYDGFHSWYSNDAKEWIPDSVKSDEDLEWSEHQVGAALQFCIMTELGRTEEDEFSPSFDMYDYCTEQTVMPIKVEQQFIEWLKSDELKKLNAEYEQELNKTKEYSDDKYPPEENTGVRTFQYDQKLKKLADSYLTEAIKEFMEKQDE